MADAAAPPVAFVVDVDALVELRRGLEAIRMDLETAKLGDLNRDAFGRDDVADAVLDFVRNWRDGRTRIDEKLTECAEILDQAIAAYGGAEQAIAAGAQPSATP
jgi:hypothetical protein